MARAKIGNSQLLSIGFCDPYRSDLSQIKSDSGALRAMSSRRVAAIVSVREYDFGRKEAVLDAGGGREARIPLADVAFPVSDRPPGIPVMIDDTMTGHAMLSTDDWTLVMLSTSAMPMIVPTKRVSFTGQG